MSVDLGFVDKSCKLLESRFFPSKIGGKPAWLDLKHIPEPRDIICDKCNQPRYFLCQIYCPFSEKDSGFHRTLFIFMCLSKDCFQPNSYRNFLVFRSQLSRKNAYYPDTPPVEKLTWRPDINCGKFGVKLCNLCGIKSSDISCSKCDKTFCSNVHKLLHRNCDSTESSEQSEKVLLPEFSINIEPENDYSDNESCSGEDTESDADGDENSVINDFEQIKKLATAQDDPTVEHFFSECAENAHDKYFFNFKSRINENPKQVIRYARDTQPLWLSSKLIPKDDDIPVCENCGSKREFEFQILPQLLNYLNLDKDKTSTAGVFDWGTLAIYTCKNSCDSNHAYQKEFLWKQDLVE